MSFGGFGLNNAPTGSPGSWFVYSETTPPLTPPAFGFKIPAPPQETFAAITDQAGPGAHILYQDIVVPAAAQTISFQVYYDNHASAFYAPNNLDPNVGTPANPNRNQQYRIDLVDPSADLDSVASNDVLLNLFRTKEGDPLSLAPILVTVNISQFQGTTVRLRLAEVDNQFMFHAGVDDVQVESGASQGTIVGIDIKPSGSDNNVNLKSGGKIRVAVISTPGFDATTVVDELSVSFGRTGDEQSLVDCDKPHKDGDGVDDLLCHFDTAATGFVEGDTEGVLKGRTVDGTPIEGRDSVRIVP